MKRVTLIPGKEPVMAYESEFKDKKYFHVRKMYAGPDGELLPGKGLAIDAKDKVAFIKALTELA